MSQKTSIFKNTANIVVNLLRHKTLREEKEMTPERINWLLRKASVNKLNERENAFIRNIARLFEKGSEISEKQALTLENIANKPFLVKRYIKKQN